MAREATLLIALVGIVGFSLWQSRSDPLLPRPANVAPASNPDVVTPQPARASAAPMARLPASEDRSRQLALPDGTHVAALNDAVDPAPLADYWGPMPWSPIVGVERSSAGVDWYRHEDGSYSTTQMVWRSDLGRHAAMTRVAHPGPTPAPPAVAKDPSGGRR